MFQFGFSFLDEEGKEDNAHYYDNLCNIKEFVKKLKDHFNNLEYNANTKRKTVSVDELKEQMDWILHTVAIQSIEDIEREMLEEI